MAPPAGGFVNVLADPRLLPRARFDALVSDLLPHCDDPNILAHELVYRRWLTPYQAAQILAGRGQDLVLGSYVLCERLGEGGMGQVFLARNWKLDTRAAIKVIRRDRAAESAAAGRFLREVRALGAIRHPHIVHALDAGLDAGRLYCAMEYVPGTDLARLLADGGPLPTHTACRYAAQLADALRHVSGLGLVHRDVKPSNVLVTADGSAVKLADLGLARFDCPESHPTHVTQIGVMVGTPDYVAPEQVQDARRADIRSDLYALGCTLYQMLAGRPPFAGKGVVEKLHQHASAEAVPIERLRPDVPPPVAAVVRTLMAKRPRDRYQDPGEVVAALRPYLLRAGDTVTDAATPTLPDLHVPRPAPPLPPTDEIPLDGLSIVREPAPAAEPWRARLDRWLERHHWLIATLLAGAGMAFVLARTG